MSNFNYVEHIIKSNSYASLHELKVFFEQLFYAQFSAIFLRFSFSFTSFFFFFLHHTSHANFLNESSNFFDTFLFSIQSLDASSACSLIHLTMPSVFSSERMFLEAILAAFCYFVLTLC